MDTMLIILTVAVIVMLFLVVFHLMGSRDNSQGVNIHTDENSKIHVSTSGSTLQIQITYESTENRPSDAFLFPDPNPLPAPAGALDRSFWLKVAAYDELSREEKDEVDARLAKSGFFHRDETSVAEAMKDEEQEAKYMEMLDNFAESPVYEYEDAEPAPPADFSPEFTY